MPWTTLVMVTVLFSVICGNRLMDNHLLRFAPSSSSSSSYMDPYETNSNRDAFLDIMPKFKDNIKHPSSELFYSKPAQELSPLRRRCNDKWLDFIKPEENYVNFDNEVSDDNEDMDTDMNVVGLPTFKDLSFYENTKHRGGLFDGRDNDRHAVVMAPPISALPVANFKDFYDDLVVDSNKQMAAMKRNGNAIGTPLGTPPARGCDCKVKNDLVDLGQQHFPRYLLNAICQTDEMGPKCWSGSVCRPLEYKVKVLTFRTVMDNGQKDLTLAWLPDDLRQIWKFKMVTVTAGCFCS